MGTKAKMRKKVTRMRHARQTRHDILHEGEVERGFWGIGVPTNEKRWMALKSEEKADKALKIIIQRKVCFGQIGTIVRLTSSSHLSHDDRIGIDKIVEFSSGRVVYMDVKRTRKYNYWLRNKLKKRDRCLLPIFWDIGDEEAVSIVTEAINWWFGIKP